MRPVSHYRIAPPLPEKSTPADNLEVKIRPVRAAAGRISAGKLSAGEDFSGRGRSYNGTPAQHAARAACTTDCSPVRWQSLQHAGDTGEDATPRRPVLS